MRTDCTFYGNLENSDFLAIMRIHRDRLLAESDWAMLADAPTNKAEWGAYRQALRDFPATWEPGPVADFPNPPGYVEPEAEAEPELPVEPLAE